MKPNMKRMAFTLFIVIALVLLWIAFSKAPFKEVMHLLGNATPILVFFYLLTYFFILSLLTLRWQFVLRSQKIYHVKFWPLFKYWLCGWTIGFLTPSAKLGGEPIRAGLLSSRHGIPFDKALSSAVIDKTIELSTSALFFVIGGLIVILGYVVSPIMREFIIIISVVFVILVFLFNYRVMKGKKFFYHLFEFFGIFRINKLKGLERRVMDFEDLIVKFYSKDKKYFFYTILVSLATWLLMFVEYKIAGVMLGLDFTVLHIFLIFSFVGAVYMLPVPMGLGALEAAQVSLFEALGISSAAGLALSLLIRVRDTILAGLGSLMLMYYGLRLKEEVKKESSLQKEIEEVRRLRKKRK